MKLFMGRGVKMWLSLVVFALVIVRLGAGLLVFWRPVLAVVLTLVIDAVDFDFVNPLGISRPNYQFYDKALDFAWYVMIMVFLFSQGLENWLLTYFFLFFCYRLVGEIVFSLTGNEKYLLWFPNYFECLFWVWLLFPSWFSSWLGAVLAFVVILPWKLFQEYLIHVTKLRTGQYFRTRFISDLVAVRLKFKSTISGK